jgi:hypothetical protein
MVHAQFDPVLDHHEMQRLDLRPVPHDSLGQAEPEGEIFEIGGGAPS